jgi:hypothetical protein
MELEAPEQQSDILSSTSFTISEAFQKRDWSKVTTGTVGLLVKCCALTQACIMQDTGLVSRNNIWLSWVATLPVVHEIPKQVKMAIKKCDFN